jgi:hypothetical protein
MHEDSEIKQQKPSVKMAEESTKGIPEHFARTLTAVLRSTLSEYSFGYARFVVRVTWLKN